MPQTLTLEQARAALDREGKSIADFAREHGLDEPTVYQVLAGTKKGRRGEAHRAAVLLGIKAGSFPPAISLSHSCSPVNQYKEFAVYADPRRVRDNRLTVRLDDYEHDLITALANYQGEQPAVLLRQLIMREASTVLSDDSLGQTTA